jgi:hypothetical protein
MIALISLVVICVSALRCPLDDDAIVRIIWLRSRIARSDRLVRGALGVALASTVRGERVGRQVAQATITVVTP